MQYDFIIGSVFFSAGLCRRHHYRNFSGPAGWGLSSPSSSACPSDACGSGVRNLRCNTSGVIGKEGSMGVGATAFFCCLRSFGIVVCIFIGGLLAPCLLAAPTRRLFLRATVAHAKAVIARCTFSNFRLHVSVTPYPRVASGCG